MVLFFSAGFFFDISDTYFILFMSIAKIQQLFYTKDTPQEYEPPMFQKAEDEGGMEWFSCDAPLYAEAGTVFTPYHHVKVSVYVQGTDKNKKGGVFQTNVKKDEIVSAIFHKREIDVEKDEVSQSPKGIEVDVGGASIGNSGRAIAPKNPCVVRDTQDTVPELHSAPEHDDVTMSQTLSLQLRVRKSQTSPKRKTVLNESTQEPQEPCQSPKRRRKNSITHRHIE